MMKCLSVITPALALGLWSAVPAQAGETPRSTRIAHYRLWVMNADGTGKGVLHESLQSQFTHPHPSPDGKTIAGVVYTGDLSGDGLLTEADLEASAIALIDADGTHLRILTDVPGEVDSHPAWSPDGSCLVFTSSAGTTIPLLWDLYTINADGSDRRKLTNTPFISEGDPHWGHNDQIAFIRGALSDVGRGKPAQVYTMDSSGRNLKRWSAVAPGGTTLFGWDTGPYDPVWDPQGRRLTWCQVPSDLSGQSIFGDFDLWVANARFRAREISPNATADLMPRWSPDGSQLVFWILFGKEGGRIVGDDIYTINSDGTARANLTLDLDDTASMPDWLPDGRILFTAVAQVDADVADETGGYCAASGEQ